MDSTTPLSRRTWVRTAIFLLACNLANSSSAAKKLDLSYLHRTKSSLLADAIRETLDHNQEVDIDITSSCIGKGVEDVVSSLQGRNAATIRLVARRNYWTPDEAAVLFKSLVGPEPAKEKTPKSKKTDSEANNTETKSNQGTTSANETEVEEEPGFASIVSLDLGWNDFSQEKRGSKIFHKALQNAVEDPVKCPHILHLDVCELGPAACRALGKGIIARYEKIPAPGAEIKSLCLHLARNQAIGDAGVAALAAALRTVASKNEGVVVFDVLDLSACGIGDTGAEALAIALEKHPLCVRCLDLSNNQISDEGAAAIGRALSSEDHPGKVEILDLSNNKDIKDAGAKAIAEAFERGTIENVIMRSCLIHADGAACFAKALKAIGQAKERPAFLRIDLSGNPLGILRKKAKSGGGMYSATALRSKATATTSAYMNLIGKTVQKGLKDLGISEAAGVNTLESDDEEEGEMNGEGEDEDPTKVKCGALAFADVFFDDELDENADNEAAVGSTNDRGDCNIELGLRHCSFDTRAGEALAAIRQEAKSTLSMDLSMDMRMNNVLEEDMISALRGDPDLVSELSEMAERYLEAMEALRAAGDRSMQAAKAATARMKAEKDMEDSWGAPVGMGDDGRDYDEQWDSDAEYDAEEDMEDFF